MIREKKYRKENSVDFYSADISNLHFIKSIRSILLAVGLPAAFFTGISYLDGNSQHYIIAIPTARPIP